MCMAYLVYVQLVDNVEVRVGWRNIRVTVGWILFENCSLCFVLFYFI